MQSKGLVAAAVTALSLASAMVATFPANATETIVVTSEADSGEPGTLRSALSEAVAGDTITFASSVHTITVGSALEIQAGVELRGPGSDVLTVFHGPGAFVTLTGVGTDSGSFDISGLRFDTPTPRGTGNFAHLSIGGSVGDVTLSDLVFSNARGSQASAARLENVSGTVSVTDSAFVNNYGWDGAHALDVRSATGDLIITRSVFDHNSNTETGAALGFSGSSESSDISIVDTSFTYSSASREGGAVYIERAATVAFDTVEGSHGSGDDGAFAYIGTVGQLDISNGYFADNYGSEGGVIAIGGVTGGVRISDSDFSKNHARTGGALALGNVDAKVVIDHSTFVDNVADTAAAVSVGTIGEGSLTIDTSTFTGNQGNQVGGVIRVADVLPAGDGFLLSNSTFASNAPIYFNKHGLAIYFAKTNGTVSMLNSTFDEPLDYSSDSMVAIGAMADSSPASILLDGVTAVGSGSALAVLSGGSGSNVSVRNSILSAHSIWSPGLRASGAAGDLAIGVDYSLVSGNRDAKVATATGSVFNVLEFGLEKLAANGGPTLTRAPRRDGPALDAGDPVEATGFDQRGYPRSEGRRDIGSVEVEAPHFADVSASNNVFYIYLQWMYASGVSTGTPQSDGLPVYKPLEPVSRQAMAAFLYRASLDGFTPPAEPTFADVPTSSAFYLEIEWMAAEGIATGTAQPTGKPLFNPTGVVSRQSMALFLARFAHAIYIYTPSSANYFADVPSDAQAAQAIAWMVQNSLTSGTPQGAGLKPLFKPLEAVSRQAMAAFIYRVTHSMVLAH